MGALGNCGSRKRKRAGKENNPIPIVIALTAPPSTTGLVPPPPPRKPSKPTLRGGGRKRFKVVRIRSLSQILILEKKKTEEVNVKMVKEASPIKKNMVLYDVPGPIPDLDELVKEGHNLMVNFFDGLPSDVDD